MIKALLPVLVVVLVARVTSAQMWHEYNDGGGEAGGLISTAQWTVGSGPLTSIIGANGGQDADLFAIYIPNPALFSATLTATWSSQLWLFAPNGHGLAYTVGSPTPTLTGQFVPGPGLYFIGESRDPYIAEGLGGAIWDTSGPFGVERAPDGPGAPGPLVGWSGHTTLPFEYYTISLQGAEYAPEPASLVLLSLGAAVLLWRRGGGVAS